MTTTTVKQDSVWTRVAGIALLLPAVLLFALVFWLPALRVLLLSLQEYNLVGPSRFVGLANYSTLLQDPALSAALGRSLVVALVRLLAVLTVPVLAGWAWARQQRWLRIAGRLVMTVPLALSAPVALAFVWVAASTRLGGAGLSLATPPQAWRSQLCFEFISFLSLGGALTATALTLAWRRPKSARSVLGVLGLAGLLAVASGFESLTFSYVAGGGPARTTETVALYGFRQAFQVLKLGQAAAAMVVPLAIALVLGLAFAFLSEGLGLRLVPAPAEPEGKVRGLPLILGLAALALLALPVLLLYLWSGGLVLFTSGNPLQSVLSSLHFGPALLNGVVAPALAIACVQLPASYLAAVSLGLLRPFGRRWSGLAFALLLASGFVPSIVVALGLFLFTRQLNLLNTVPALVLPLLAGPASLYIFKLHFAGRRPAVVRAQMEGRTFWQAFFRLAFLPSLPVGVLAGAASFLIAGQSLLWPLVVISRRDLFPLSLQMLAFSSTSSGPAGSLAAGWLLLTCWGVGLFLLWGVLQALVVERLALASGAEVEEVG